MFPCLYSRPSFSQPVEVDRVYSYKNTRNAGRSLSYFFEQDVADVGREDGREHGWVARRCML